MAESNLDSDGGGPSFKVLKTGHCMLQEVYPEHRDHWEMQRHQLTSVYFSQSAGQIHLASQDSPAPDWFTESEAHLRSHYEVAMGHCELCQSLLYRQAAA